MTMNTLECLNLRKSFNAHLALADVSLTVPAGQLLALLGPSGCGKTTTLRLIAGFEWPDAGTIRLSGQTVAGEGVRLPAEKRRVGMVFQEYALFPHLDVVANIAFGLKTQGNARQKRVDELLELVGLREYATFMPHELSGGQQQRIALARALAPGPDILLLDEPFSNLDAGMRMQVRAEVREILRQAAITTIFVTHDQEEALSLADEVAIMLGGRVMQVDEPQRLYHAPATREVAAFVGESNFLPGEAQGGQVDCVLGELPLVEQRHGAVDVLIRPESLLLTPATPNGASADAYVTWREFYGHDQRIGVTLHDGTALIARADANQVFTIGASVTVGVAGALRAFSI